ncbi:hypothetical protein [Ruegeria sp. HKCCD7255]|uniref:hypothetical protein n=1 Tax=Ruegeria sp. HKCCD7255 TaxID=2683004 RepID=UPI001489CC1F|nr:hypothetical protein [Ruegeria sp. HKCCD7255]
MFLKSKSWQPKFVGLVGDGDEIDLLEDFEAAFQITFSEQDAESLLNLGDVKRLICSKLTVDRAMQAKCLGAMAYYRLNRAIRETGKTPPKTYFVAPIDLTPKEFQKQLESVSDLKLDFLTRPSAWVVALASLQFVSWTVALFLFSGFNAVLAVILVFGLTHTLWRFAANSDGWVWQFEGSFEDLCNKAVETNFGKLVSLGGRWSDADVWKCMTSIVESNTGFPANRMEPSLRLI